MLHFDAYKNIYPYMYMNLTDEAVLGLHKCFETCKPGCVDTIYTNQLSVASIPNKSAAEKFKLTSNRTEEELRCVKEID